jgi:hypothetical protein
MGRPGLIGEPQLLRVLETEECPGAGICEVVGQFAALREDVDGDGDRPHLHDGVVGNGELRSVWAGEENRVPPSDSDSSQAVRKLVDLLGQLSVGKTA